jgi:hypothetical protein
MAMDWIPRATGRFAPVVFGLTIVAAPINHAAASGSQCSAFQYGSVPHWTRAGYWHLTLRHEPTGEWPGFYPHLYWDNGCPGSVQSRVYYCLEPAGYSPEVVGCRVRWQTIYADPLPVEPVPAN